MWSQRSKSSQAYYDLLREQIPEENAITCYYMSSSKRSQIGAWYIEGESAGKIHLRWCWENHQEELGEIKHFTFSCCNLIRYILILNYDLKSE